MDCDCILGNPGVFFSFFSGVSNKRMKKYIYFWISEDGVMALRVD